MKTFEMPVITITKLEPRDIICTSVWDDESWREEGLPEDMTPWG